MLRTVVLTLLVLLACHVHIPAGVPGSTGAEAAQETCVYGAFGCTTRPELLLAVNGTNSTGVNVTFSQLPGVDEFRVYIARVGFNTPLYPMPVDPARNPTVASMRSGTTLGDAQDSQQTLVATVSSALANGDVTVRVGNLSTDATYYVNVLALHRSSNNRTAYNGLFVHTRGYDGAAELPVATLLIWFLLPFALTLVCCGCLSYGAHTHTRRPSHLLGHKRPERQVARCNAVTALVCLFVVCAPIALGAYYGVIEPDFGVLAYMRETTCSIVSVAADSNSAGNTTMVTFNALAPGARSPTQFVRSLANLTGDPNTVQRLVGRTTMCFVSDYYARSTSHLLANRPSLHTRSYPVTDPQLLTYRLATPEHNVFLYVVVTTSAAIGASCCLVNSFLWTLSTWRAGAEERPDDSSDDEIYDEEEAELHGLVTPTKTGASASMGAPERKIVLGKL